MLSSGNDRCLENASRVGSRIKKDPKLVYADIQEIIKISSGSLTRILHDCLGIRKGCARWVPHGLSEEQKRCGVDCAPHAKKIWRRKVSSRMGHCNRGLNLGIPIRSETNQQSAVWVLPNENPFVKFKRNRSTSKQMIACFFAKFGHIAIIPLEDRKTFTADWYVNHCLP